MIKNCKIRIRTIGLLTFLLISVNMLTAQISLNFVFEPNTNDTTATYSGSWGEGTFGNTNVAPQAYMNSTFFYALPQFMSNASFSIATPYPWAFAVADAHYGDAFGFDYSGVIYANTNYAAGQSIAGSIVFYDKNLSDLGFDESEIASGGVLGSGLNTVTWSASVSAVPEPSSAAFLIGVISVAATATRRRRHRSTSIS